MFGKFPIRWFVPTQDGSSPSSEKRAPTLVVLHRNVPQSRMGACSNSCDLYTAVCTAGRFQLLISRSIRQGYDHTPPSSPLVRLKTSALNGYRCLGEQHLPHRQSGVAGLPAARYRSTKTSTRPPLWESGRHIRCFVGFVTFFVIIRTIFCEVVPAVQHNSRSPSSVLAAATICGCGLCTAGFPCTDRGSRRK